MTGLSVSAEVVFQSTHPRGVRHGTAESTGEPSTFQSTHPRGVRRRPLGHWAGIDVFQSTHPRGVRRAGRCRRRRAGSFNPRTREGCDSKSMIVPSLVRGFNPRTREGCDTYLRRLADTWHSFNPRTREGCDYLALLQVDAEVVSIHAPARGATPSSMCGSSDSTFQSTHPRGVRPSSTPSAAPCMVFQSTHPRGVRLSFYSFYDASVPIIMQLSGCI